MSFVETEQATAPASDLIGQGTQEYAVLRLAPLLAWLFAVLCTTLPILAHPYLPLVDLPNHVARLHIAAMPSSSPLSQYYEYTAALVPNSAADLLWRALPAGVDPVRFAQLLMAIYAVNMVTATMVLGRVLQGRWSVWHATSALLVYSEPFLWGFQNFIFSLPFCLYGIALWCVMSERKAGLWRALVFIPFLLTLYLMHFFAFAILAIAVFGVEVQRLLSEEGPISRRIFALCLRMTPFALPVIWLAWTILSTSSGSGLDETGYGRLSLRLWALASPMWAPNAAGFPLMNVTAYVGLAILALCLTRLCPGDGPRLVLSPKAKGPVIALAIAAALAPSFLNGVGYVHIRIPVLLVALLIAGTAWRGLSPRLTQLLFVGFVLVVAGRSVAFERFAAKHERDIQDMFSVAEQIPAGARVLPLRAPGRHLDARFYHIQGYLVYSRDVFVPTLFQGVHALRVKDEWQKHAEHDVFSIDLRLILDPNLITSSPPPIFTHDWEHKFTHAILFDRVDPSVVDDPRLQPVASVGRFTLFRIHPSAQSAPRGSR